jgi:hypothetical protein
MLKLFITAFLQVFFVAGNTVFIAKQNYTGAAVFGFAISWLWTANIKKIACGTTTDRFIYAIGATCGGLTGMYLASLIFPYL